MWIQIARQYCMLCINESFPVLAASVLLRGDHFHEHPLQVLYSILYDSSCVDMRAYKDNNGVRHLWAEMYQNFNSIPNF
jgi:hypothetical protein